MITALGKFLRILRISKDQSAKEMADAIGVSSSYLSAIENGKRSIPTNLENILISKYNLSEADKKKLREAIEASSQKLKIDLSDASDMKKKILLTIANDEMDSATLERLCAILETKE